MGAVNFIYEPISPSILLARIKIYLNLKAAYDSLHEKNTLIEKQIQLGKMLQEVILPKPLPKLESLKLDYVALLYL